MGLWVLNKSEREERAYEVCEGPVAAKAITHESFLEASESSTNFHLCTLRFPPHESSFRSCVNQKKACHWQAKRAFLQRKGPFLLVDASSAGTLLGKQSTRWVSAPSSPQLYTFVQDPNCPSMLIFPKSNSWSPQKCSELSRNWISPRDNVYW